MIPQFLIVFREALEAALIVGIVGTYLSVAGKPESRKYLYLGVVSAICISLVLGITVISALGGIDDKSEQIFEGSASLIAASVLTYMIIWMGKNSKNIRRDLETKIRISVNSNQMMGIFFLAFTSVFREGLETVLFLTALANDDPLGTLIGTVLGLFVVTALGIITMGAFSRIRVDRVFRYSSILLLVFAAGLVGYGVHELIEAYEEQIPLFLKQSAWDINPPNANHPLHENGVIGSIMKSLVGYDGNPEVLRVLAYTAYWIITGSYLVRTYKQPVKSKISGNK
jgi:high-affinity iron transporter